MRTIYLILYIVALILFALAVFGAASPRLANIRFNMIALGLFCAVMVPFLVLARQ